VIICMNCLRPVTFGDRGWQHRDTPECDRLTIAWPPPVETDDDAEADTGTAA
jgi:hypothetical protein